MIVFLPCAYIPILENTDCSQKKNKKIKKSFLSEVTDRNRNTNFPN